MDRTAAIGKNKDRKNQDDRKTRIQSIKHYINIQGGPKK